MSVAAFDVVVIGAGIVGAACAAECAQRGMQVLIVEGQGIGGGATAAGMGHIVAMDDSEAQFRLTRFSQQLWHELRPQLPADVEFETCGTLWVAADEAEMQEVERKRDYYRQHGVPAEMLDAAALREQEPQLRPGLAGGLLVPKDAVVYPPCAARYLVDRAVAAGARLSLGRAAARLGAGQVRLTDGTAIAAHRIVNAAGAWAPELNAGLAIKKRKGHLLITDRYAGFVRHQIVELGYLKSAHSLTRDSVAFNVQPRQTGQVLIGSSRQFGAEDAAVEAEMLARMLRRAQAYMPGLARLSALRAWTGFRAATPDKVPLIGPWPQDETILLATGHEGLGITTSLATGRLVAELLAGAPPSIPMEPYLPARKLSFGDEFETAPHGSLISGREPATGAERWHADA